MTSRTTWLTTGQAARLLGCSRQHVVDLCERGDLSFEVVGTHRRIRRADVEMMSGTGLTRDQERSLWLHRVVAGRLAVDTDGVITKARANLEQLNRIHSRGMTAVWLSKWEEVLDEGVDALFEALTSRLSWAVELRQNSPFAGVLKDEERRDVLGSFRKHWRDEHAA